MIQEIKELAEGMMPELSKMRRHLHAHPELSFKETKTADFIEEQLIKIGISDYYRISETGIVALIKGKNPDNKCIALRADMDALPISEDNEVDYRSKNEGVMHACGHDVHTTCLLGAATILYKLKSKFEGTIKLIFQPGEEQSPGGASILIKQGVLENPKPLAIYALHVDPSIPSGEVGFRPGEYMASADEIHITIHGKGGHAALPHLTIDPITIAAYIITSLQQIVSRKCNPTTPTVLSFGKIEGGKANNVIPDEVKLSGTFRTFDEQWRKDALELIKKTVHNIADIHGAKATVHIPPGYPTLFNNRELTEQSIATAAAYLEASNIHQLELRMTAEDFSFYAQKVPACFFRLGTNKNNTEFTASVHTPHFDIDESALKTGAGLLAELAINKLKL